MDLLSSWCYASGFCFQYNFSRNNFSFYCFVVVKVALWVPTNQSAAKIFSTNQNRAFRSGDSFDVTMPIYGHENLRDPMG